MRTRRLAGSASAAAVGRPAPGRHTRQYRPAAGASTTARVRFHAGRGAPARVPREAPRPCPPPTTGNGSVRRRLHRATSSPLHFPTLRARKQMPLCSRGITKGYAVLSPRTQNRARSRASVRSVPPQPDAVAIEHRSVAAGGRARAAYPAAGIPPAQCFAHDDHGVHDARPCRAGVGAL